MKHHIFHKSYRHIHVISLTVAVIIAGVWVHVSTQRANSEIKLGVSIRDIQTTNSADIGRIKESAPAPAPEPGGGAVVDGGRPDSGTESGSTTDSASGTSLSARVKNLLGIAPVSETARSQASGEGANGGAVATVATDPCLALVSVNTKGVFVRESTMSFDEKSTVKNPCSYIPTELLPCAANYEENAKAARPAAFHFIPRAEAESDTPPVSVPAATSVETRGTGKVSTSPCTYAEGSTAKESLRNTLLDNLDSLLPNVTLQSGDSGSNVELLQKLIAINAGTIPEKLFNKIGVFDKGMADQVAKFQDRVSEELNLNPKLKADGIYNSATRTAFVNIMKGKIDEFLAIYKKDFALSTDQTPDSATLFTQIDLTKTVPIAAKDAKSETVKDKSTAMFDGDPCLVLSPSGAIPLGLYTRNVVSGGSVPSKYESGAAADSVWAADSKTSEIGKYVRYFSQGKKGGLFNPCGNIPERFLPCAANYEVDEKSLSALSDVVNSEKNGQKLENPKQALKDAVSNLKVVSNHSVEACHFIPATTANESLVKTLMYYVGVTIPVDSVFKLGDTGDSVIVLQQLLGSFGDSEVEQTGVYDEGTVKYVTKFQSNAGLVADGSFGGETRKALLTTLGNLLNKFLSIYVDKNNLNVNAGTKGAFPDKPNPAKSAQVAN